MILDIFFIKKGHKVNSSSSEEEIQKLFNIFFSSKL